MIWPSRKSGWWLTGCGTFAMTLLLHFKHTHLHIYTHLHTHTPTYTHTYTPTQPPPPGVAPTPAQMAVQRGQPVVAQQQAADIFGGGSDGGYTFFWWRSHCTYQQRGSTEWREPYKALREGYIKHYHYLCEGVHLWYVINIECTLFGNRVYLAKLFLPIKRRMLI